MRFRATILSLAILSPLAFGVNPRAPDGGLSEAHGAVSLLLSLDELVQQSAYVVVAQAVEQKSAWEQIAGSRRIVTYTRMVIESAVVGEPGKEVWVRTRGGAVGQIGQAVSGEAQLAPGSSSLLFLAQVDSALVVTGMAQGHYLVVTDAGGTRKLAASPDAGALVRRRGPTIAAREILLGSTLDQALAAVKGIQRVPR